MRDPPTHPVLSVSQQTLNIFHILGFISGELQNEGKEKSRKPSPRTWESCFELSPDSRGR